MPCAGACATATRPSPPPAGRWTPRPDELIGRFYFDTITHDPALLAALVEAVGAERVLLGSDYPFDMGDPDPVSSVRGAALGPEAELAVLWGNAARLLGLPELSHA